MQKRISQSSTDIGFSVNPSKFDILYFFQGREKKAFFYQKMFCLQKMLLKRHETIKTFMLHSLKIKTKKPTPLINHYMWLKLA